MILSTGSFLMAVFGFIILYGGFGFCLSISLRKRIP